MTAGPALVCLGRRGFTLARRVADALADSSIHAPRRLATDALAFDEFAPHLRLLFEGGAPLVVFAAAGIVVRSLAPCLADKTGEPPVVAVGEDGRHVVPLLGGHRGANALAQRVAELLGASAAVTTASDGVFGLALDEPPPGWRVNLPDDFAAFVRRIIDGEPVRVTAEAGGADWLSAGRLPIAAEARLELLATPRRAAASTDRVVYHPPVLALGVGAERDVSADALEACVRETLERHDLAAESIACVVSHELKAAEPAIHALAGSLGVPAHFFATERLLAETSRLVSPSEAAFRATGCWGVAEGAALAAVGSTGRLLAPKSVGRGVTCAIAQAADAIDARAVGRSRGSLTLVGVGPGAREWRTPEAEAAIRAAGEVVGYAPYLELVGDLLGGRGQHRFALGEEARRCRHALDLAATGKDVALLGSGDAGIYAMASLVFELLAASDDPAHHRVLIGMVPGVTAMQAAAARLGAPLGNDFCAISLSDLHTPWPIILRRLRAAAEADFVVALYNPSSQTRRPRFEEACDLLARHREPATPCGLARDLGRAGERIEVVALADLARAEVDMLTTVIVGSNTTRRLPRLHGPDWLFTPRGYDLA